MKITWKLRIKNNTTLISLIGVVLSFIYTLLGSLGIVPAISQDNITTLILGVVEALAAVGIIVDPTTTGIEDSTRALGYSEPSKG